MKRRPADMEGRLFERRAGTAVLAGLLFLILEFPGLSGAAATAEKLRRVPRARKDLARFTGVGKHLEARLCRSILQNFESCEDRARREIEEAGKAKGMNASGAGPGPRMDESQPAGPAAAQGAVGPAVPIAGRRVCPPSAGPHELFFRLCALDISAYEADNKYIYGVEASSDSELKEQCAKLEMMYQQAAEEEMLTLPAKVPGNQRPLDVEAFCRAVSHLDFAEYTLEGYSASPLPDSRPGQEPPAAAENSWLAALKKSLR